MEARVTTRSQAYRLRERMEQAEVQHGQEIRADLPGIGVTAMARGWFAAQDKGRGEVFFCTMQVTIFPKNFPHIHVHRSFF